MEVIWFGLSPQPLVGWSIGSDSDPIPPCQSFPKCQGISSVYSQQQEGGFYLTKLATTNAVSLPVLKRCEREGHFHSVSHKLTWSWSD